MGLERNEVRLAGELDELRRDLRRLAQEACRGVEMRHEVARVARAERDVALLRVLHDPLGGLRVVLELLLRADAAQDLPELWLRRRLQLDLVLDAPEERLVDERRRRAVRRENEEHVEAHLDLAAVGEREEVDVPIERDDPAVEELIRRGALAPEVIDEQDAAARLHLEGRLVHLGERVVSEIELLERELAADLHERARDRDPAAVEALVEREERAVPRRIEHADDLLADLDDVRDDDVPLEERRKRLRDRRLSGAGRAEEEDRSPAVDRGSELAQRAIGKHEVAERLLELLHRDLEAAHGLRAHAADVRAERHRRGPDVAALVEGLARAGGARVGEHVLVRLRADARRALHLGEALVLQEVEDGRQDRAEGDAEHVRELTTRRLARLVEDLEREVADEARGEAGLLDGLRRERCRRLGRRRRRGGTLCLDRQTSSLPVESAPA